MERCMEAALGKMTPGSFFLFLGDAIELFFKIAYCNI